MKKKKKKTISITAPLGTSGLAVEPWSKGEIYAVAADWAQSSSPIMVYGDGSWTTHPSGLQVADFQHNVHAALAATIRDSIAECEGVSSDDVDDDEVNGIMSGAAEISRQQEADWEPNEFAFLSAKNAK